jgi:hypothetical protein
METFFKMCQECGIVDHVHVLKEDCYVVYRAVVSKRADLHTGRGTSLGSHGKLTISEQAKSLMVRSDPGVKHAAVKKMQFSDWLSALSELAKKRFGESNDEVDDINSFERLIMDNLVPATKFRSAVPVALDEVRHLYKDFGPAFRDVIQYYGEFVGSEEKEDEAKRGGSRLSVNKGMNSMSSNMSFAKWLQFCDDFNLRSSMSNTPILTSVELADIFLQAVRAQSIDYLGKLNFQEFWEAIVRCAQVAYRFVDTSLENKVKELFVNMSHKIDQSISKSVNFTGMRDVSTYGALIISGMKKFQLALNTLYRRDGIPQSYLTRRVKPNLSGRQILSALKSKQDSTRRRRVAQNRRLSEIGLQSATDEIALQEAAKKPPRRHARNRSMENKDAALAGLSGAYMSTRGTRQQSFGGQDNPTDTSLAIIPVDNRPPPSTRAVPRITNDSASRDTSYRALLQQREARKLRARTNAAKRATRRDPYLQRTDTPTSTAPMAPPSQGSGGWWAAVDNSTGRMYYYNRKTGESGWQLPPGIDETQVRVNKKVFHAK